VAEIGDDVLEIAAKLVATAVDPSELNAVATDLQPSAWRASCYLGSQHHGLNAVFCALAR